MSAGSSSAPQPSPQPRAATEAPSASDTVKMMASGGIAGAFAKTCTAPLARLTILYQVQGFGPGKLPCPITGKPIIQPTLRQAFKQVVQQEGLLSLWKGNGVTILHRLPYSAINFSTYEHSMALLSRAAPSAPEASKRFAAGAAAAVAACTAAYPLDLVRTRLAAQTSSRYYHGVIQTLRRIISEEGRWGLYRGLGATLMQVVPNLAINFTIYGGLRAYMVSLNEARQQALEKRRQQLQEQRRQQQQSSSRGVGELQQWHEACSSSSSSSSGGGGFSRAGVLAFSVAQQQQQQQQHSSSSTPDWHTLQDSLTPPHSSSSSLAASALQAYNDAHSLLQQQHSSSHPPPPPPPPPAAPATSSLNTFQSLLCGCASGFAASSLTFPLDLVRRRMQVRSGWVMVRRGMGAGHSQPPSYAQVVGEVLRQSGPRGLYAGIVPEYCKVIPGVAIAFCAYEQLKRALAVADMD